MKTLLLAGTVCLCLCACGSGNGELPASTLSPTAVPTAVPTATPTPTPEPVTEVTLGEESAGEIQALAGNPALAYVDGRSSAEYAALLELSRLRPDCRVEWVYPLCGLAVESSATEIVFSDGDPVDAAGLLAGLEYLPYVEQVDLCAHDMAEADMTLLTEKYPGIRFLWMVSFGKWTVRSDITCFSTLQPGAAAYRWTDEDLAPLFRFCTELRALDLGHNDLRDLTPLAGLKQLQVLILVDNPNLTDASPIGELENLEYLEFFLNKSVSDYSFLSRLTKLRDVNLSYAPITGLDFLDAMPDLSMAWLGFCPLAYEDILEAREKHPEATIKANYNGSISSTAAGWRAGERNVAIRKAFTNWESVVCFAAWNDVQYLPGAKLIETYPNYEDG